MPIYLTEFGVQSKPNRYDGVSVAKQAEYDAISERIAWSNPRVAAFSQYLLRDDPLGGPPVSARRRLGFQTGLEYVNGQPKPLYYGWPVPLAVTKQGHGFSLWGLVRPATRPDQADGARAAQGLQRATRTLKTVTTNSLGYWTLHSSTAGLALARALGQPHRRQVRRPADRRLLTLGPVVAAGAAATRRARPGAPTMGAMPELPEVEITARLLDEALRGARIESALAPGINALKTFDPPLSALDGREIVGVRRRGKHLIVEVAGELALLIHLMSAGRLQLYDKRAGPRDRTSRLLVRLDDGRELRLREFGTKQAAWVKLLRAERARAGRGARDARARRRGRPPPPLEELLDALAPAAHAAARPARDRRHRALLGRRDPLGGAPVAVQARRRPRRGRAERLRSRDRRARSARAIAHYERAIELPIPDKLPMPLRVHRHEGEPCPRCADDAARPSTSRTT